MLALSLRQLSLHKHVSSGKHALVYVHIMSTTPPHHLHALACPILTQSGIIGKPIPISTRRVSRKATLLRDAIDPSQHELYQTIRGTRRILRDHMPAETDFYESQASLSMGCAEDTSTC